MEESKTVRGKIASPGKVKGKVLVAEATNPAFTPLIAVLSAVITNLGGTLCHVAIVSREYGIPCIVGTKIATKVFRDGDLVEVDANKGIVRKIEK